MRGGLEELVMAGHGGFLRFREQGRDLLLVHGLKGADGLECLVEDGHGIDAGDDDGRG